MNYDTNNDHDNVDDALAALTGTTTKAIGDLTQKLADMQRQTAKLEAKIGRPMTGGDYSEVKNVLALESKALAKFIRTGDDTELKTMSVGSDPDGGYGVTAQLSTEIVKRLYDQSPMHQICRTVEVGSFDSY